MTQQPTVAATGHDHADAPEVRHEHTSTCFWDLGACRWQCTTYPLLVPGGRPPAGLEINAPLWYAHGFLDALSEVRADRDLSVSPLASGSIQPSTV